MGVLPGLRQYQGDGAPVPPGFAEQQPAGAQSIGHPDRTRMTDVQHRREVTDAARGLDRDGLRRSRFVQAEPPGLARAALEAVDDRDGQRPTRFSIRTSET